MCVYVCARARVLGLHNVSVGIFLAVNTADKCSVSLFPTSYGVPATSVPLVYVVFLRKEKVTLVVPQNK